MISHQYKCIFIEVPKTGSSSIRSLLGVPPNPHANLWEIRHELARYWTRHGGALNRVLASLYLLLPAKRRQKIGARIFQSYFKFGFVRNPWDRVVSLYERREGLQIGRSMGFEEFVEWARFASSTCIHPVPHRNQLDWFVDPHGNVLVDLIGRFENLESDWALIARKLGIHKPLPHENRNPRRTRHYTEYYTDRSRDLIAERFRVDIEFFGYEFGADPTLPALCFDGTRTASPGCALAGCPHKEQNSPAPAAADHGGEGFSSGSDLPRSKETDAAAIGSAIRQEYLFTE